jgi:hypothetical protein
MVLLKKNRSYIVITWAKGERENLKKDLIYLNENISQLHNNDYVKVVKVGDKENLVGISSWLGKIIFWFWDFISWGGETKKVNDFALKILSSMKDQVNSEIPFGRFYKCDEDDSFYDYATNTLYKIKESSQLKKNKTIKNLKLPKFPGDPIVEENFFEHNSYGIKVIENNDRLQRCYDGKVDFTKVLKLDKPLKKEDKILLNYYFYEKWKEIFKKKIDESSPSNVEEFVEKQIKSYKEVLKKVEELISENKQLYFSMRMMKLSKNDPDKIFKIYSERPHFYFNSVHSIKLSQKYNFDLSKLLQKHKENPK